MSQKQNPQRSPATTTTGPATGPKMPGTDAPKPVTPGMNRSPSQPTPAAKPRLGTKKG